MFYEPKEISYSGNFQMAIDRCCDVQVQCATQMARAMCEVWCSMIGFYISGVAQGFRCLTNCYLCGVQCFCNSWRPVGGEFCSGMSYVAPNKTANRLFHTLEMVAEYLAHEYGKLSKAEYFMILQTLLGKLGPEMVIKLSKDLVEAAETMGDMMGTIDKAKASQTLSEVLKKAVKLFEEDKEEGATKKSAIATKKTAAKKKAPAKKKAAKKKAPAKKKTTVKK